MYQPVTLFIGLRYLRGRENDQFGCLVSRLSAIGITLGVLALVTVLSVMNGFEKELEKNTLNLMPQAVLTKKSGHLSPKQYPTLTQTLQGVTRVEPFTTGEAILQSADGLALSVMLGIMPNQPEPLLRTLVSGEADTLKSGHYNVIISAALAQQLKVRRGDKLRLVVPASSIVLPVGGLVPNQRFFTVSAIYETGSDLDKSQILVNQQDAGRMLRYPDGEVSGFRLWLTKPLAVESTSQQALPAELVWHDWREQKGDLFQAVQMEKKMMGLLLGLIVAVAAFNIVTSLSLLIMEKQSEVAILQTLGLQRRQILAIFIIQGATAGLIGSIIGALGGVLLATKLNVLLHYLDLSIVGGNLPVDIHPTQIIMITLLAMLTAFVATLYPSWRATTVQPAEALRYE